MKKTLATALLIGALSFSSAPAFAINPDPSQVPSNCQTLSPGVTECVDVLETLTTGVVVEPTAPSEAVELTYPAPTVTPNTTNGVPPASANPTPTPAPVTQELANTGANNNLAIWGGVGLLALIAGVISVVRARKSA